MPVVILMSVVVAKNTAIVDGTYPRIDVCQAVLHQPITLVPDFFFQYRTSPFAGEVQGLVNPLFPLDGFGSRFSAHDVRRAGMTDDILADGRGDVKYPGWKGRRRSLDRLRQNLGTNQNPPCRGRLVGTEGVPDGATHHKCPVCGELCAVVWPTPEEREAGYLPQLESHRHGGSRRRARPTRR